MRPCGSSNASSDSRAIFRTLTQARRAFCSVVSARPTVAAIAWFILQTLIVRTQGGAASRLARALGRDWKGRLSPLLYLAGIAASFRVAGLAQALYLLAALIWLVPDRRLERAITEDRPHS